MRKAFFYVLLFWKNLTRMSILLEIVSCSLTVLDLCKRQVKWFWKKVTNKKKKQKRQVVNHFYIFDNAQYHWILHTDKIVAYETERWKKIFADDAVVK